MGHFPHEGYQVVSKGYGELKGFPGLNREITLHSDPAQADVRRFRGFLVKWPPLIVEPGVDDGVNHVMPDRLPSLLGFQRIFHDLPPFESLSGYHGWFGSIIVSILPRWKDMSRKESILSDSYRLLDEMGIRGYERT